ncbi:MAG TPA: glycogen-binding domain-containing protein [Gemmatimonadaceae bacterium]|jgi:hypothetical protein|nr:glycogen-binding domain-containing protein [Gemmatimonadaceae bacterium]
MITRWTLAVTATLAVAAHGVSAQTMQGSLALSGGSATDAAGLTARAATITPTLTLSPAPDAAFALSASGTRFDNEQWAAASSLGVALRKSLASWARATLDADAGGTTTSYNYSYGTAGVLPALETTVGGMTAYAGMRLAAASTSRTSSGGLAGANLRIADANGESLILGARIERARIDSITQVDRSATAALYYGSLGISGSLAWRADPAASTMFGSVGLSLAVTHATALTLSAGAYPADRLVGTPAGRFFTVGATLLTGTPRTSGASRQRQPEAAGAPGADAGMTRLTLIASDARVVEVAGDFTNWQFIRAERAANGVWYVDLRIPPGQYRYAFRTNGAKWIVPAGVEVVDDDFGGKAAWLVVGTPGTAAR